MCPKRRVAPPTGLERVQPLATLTLGRLRKVDRRLWPLITAAVVVLAVVLAVVTRIPEAATVGLIAVKPILFGCALWLGYECLRRLILARTRPGWPTDETSR